MPVDQGKVNNSTLGLTPTALDEQGKAMFGTPGPGTYAPPSSFRTWSPTSPNSSLKKKTYPTGDPGKQVYEVSPAYSITGRNFGIDAKSENPSPAAYNPAVELSKPASERTVFGTSDREHEQHRFYSELHNKANPPQDTPGPGTYRLAQTKIAPRMAPSHHTNLPSWKFGSAPQREDEYASANAENPGPEYDPMIKSGAPAYTFAPQGDLKMGATRNRDEGARLYISALHAEADKTYTSAETPGAGAYGSPEITNLSPNKKEAMYSFAKAKRAQDKQFISEMHLRADPALGTAKETPGFVYEYPNVLDQRAAVFGTGPRMYAPENGGNAGGPFISKLHAEACTGFEGPGPGAYLRQEGNDLPQIKFGSSTRDDAIYAISDGPGPGAYNPKAEKSSKLWQSGAYSVASNLRTDFTNSATKENPGPGQYDLDGKTDAESRRSKAPAYSLGGGTKGIRDSFVPKLASPGPGTYEQDYERMSSPTQRASSSPVKKGFSFGVRERTKHEKSTVSVRYHGPLASQEQLGTNSPGPCAYQIKESRAVSKTDDAPMYKFGKAARDQPKQFISRVHADAGQVGMDSPGPGTYESQKSVVVASKHKNGAAFSFGTSQRPALASVRF